MQAELPSSSPCQVSSLVPGLQESSPACAVGVPLLLAQSLPKIQAVEDEQAYCKSAGSVQGEIAWSHQEMSSLEGGVGLLEFSSGNQWQGGNLVWVSSERAVPARHSPWFGVDKKGLQKNI